MDKNVFFFASYYKKLMYYIHMCGDIEITSNKTTSVEKRDQTQPQQ